MFTNRSTTKIPKRLLEIKLNKSTWVLSEIIKNKDKEEEKGDMDKSLAKTKR